MSREIVLPLETQTWLPCLSAKDRTKRPPRIASTTATTEGDGATYQQQRRHGSTACDMPDCVIRLPLIGGFIRRFGLINRVELISPPVDLPPNETHDRDQQNAEGVLGHNSTSAFAPMN